MHGPLISQVVTKNFSYDGSSSLPVVRRMFCSEPVLLLCFPVSAVCVRCQIGRRGLRAFRSGVLANARLLLRPSTDELQHRLHTALRLTSAVQASGRRPDSSGESYRACITRSACAQLESQA